MAVIAAYSADQPESSHMRAVQNTDPVTAKTFYLLFQLVFLAKALEDLIAGRVRKAAGESAAASSDVTIGPHPPVWQKRSRTVTLEVGISYSARPSEE